MSSMKSRLGPMRPPFLLLPPVCVLLGLATAIREQGSVNPLYVVLALVGAVAAHISVNALNEYSDFKSGLDLKTSRTPFSGGSGTLPAEPGLLGWALGVGVATLVLTALIGIFFLFVWGWALLPLGLAGLVVIAAYTPWATRVPFFCLVAPGLGFGSFMVIGTHVALTGTYSWSAVIASFVPFFLVSDLLLLNQFPDVDADRGIGRRHLPIVIGRKKSALVYGAFLLGAFVSIVTGVALGEFPTWSLLGLIALILAVPVSLKVYRNADDIPALIPAMGQNVILNLVTPVLLAVGLLVG